MLKKILIRPFLGLVVLTLESESLKHNSEQYFAQQLCI
jgi:hypothetical protein